MSESAESVWNALYSAWLLFTLDFQISLRMTKVPCRQVNHLIIRLLGLE